MYRITPMREPVEFQSSPKWGSWPLVHVPFGGVGSDGQQLRHHARGIIAIGITAIGDTC